MKEGFHLKRALPIIIAILLFILPTIATCEAVEEATVSEAIDAIESIEQTNETAANDTDSISSFLGLLEIPSTITTYKVSELRFARTVKDAVVLLDKPDDGANSVYTMTPKGEQIIIFGTSDIIDNDGYYAVLYAKNNAVDYGYININDCADILPSEYFEGLKNEDSVAALAEAYGLSVEEFKGQTLENRTAMAWRSQTGKNYHAINSCGTMNPLKAQLVTIDGIALQPCARCKPAVYR